MGLQCTLETDQQEGVYQAGDLVSGRVILILEERNLLKGFALKVAGYTEIGWLHNKNEKQQQANTQNGEQSPTNEDLKKIEHFINREDYIATVNYFMGSEAASPRLIESGNYTYPFSFRLPESCPSSFDGPFGHIRYELEIFVEFPEKRHTCLTRQLFLKNLRDLRREPQLFNPVNVQHVEPVGRGKFWRKPIELYVNIPQGGFIPGDNVSIHLKVLNEDQIAIRNIAYRLNQIHSYIGVCKKKTKTKSEKKTMYQIENLPPLQNLTNFGDLQNVKIPVDAIPSLTSKESKFLQISYEVEVELQTKPAKRTCSISVPIQIGTIPLNTNEAAQALEGNPSKEQLEISYTNVYVPTAPVADTPTMTVTMNTLVSSFQEPEFMAATQLNEKKKKHNMAGDKQEFKPKYLVYDMANSHTSNTQTQEPQASTSQIRQANEMEKVPF